jgi:arylsulfatase A-like enzyme
MTRLPGPRRGMNRRKFLKAALSLPLINLPSPPNILLIMADDLGYTDLGCYGNPLIKTPHLDALAAHGMRFLNAYAPCPKCAPTRWCMMTGKQMDAAHSLINLSIIQPEDRPILPEWLKTRGYRTGLVGKWGVFEGVGDNAPNLCGFDYFYGFKTHNEAFVYFPPYVWENEQQIATSGYSMDLLLQAALGFVAQATRPFFLYFPTPAPHANNNFALYGENGWKEIPINPIYAGYDWPDAEKCYASLITRIDRDVGQLVAAVPQNTIVFFCSDNGPAEWGQHEIDFFAPFPYRGAKDLVWEGGIRVPLIAKWPGWIESGVTTDHVCLTSDIYATVREIWQAS